jgi:peptidoglycan/xylan/chitin deacetylase (PgdA/CDA1 family)
VSKSAVAAKVLHASGVASIARKLPTWSGLLVLNYHRIGRGRPSSEPDGGVTGTTRAGLDEQLRFLVRHADVISPTEVTDVLGKRGRHLLITFDDGYRDNHELAFPVLRSHGVSAAFFLATGFLDRPRLSWWDELGWMVGATTHESLPAGEWLDAPVALGDHAIAVRALTGTYKQLPGDRGEAFLDWCGDVLETGRAPGELADGMWMTWDMVREMRDGGMVFGGHTESHHVLARLSRDAQEREIAACERRLREELDQAMSLFSYPVGKPDSFDADTRAILADHGVEVAFSCYGGYEEPGEVDRYDVRRTTASASADPAKLNAILVSPRHFARW